MHRSLFYSHLFQTRVKPNCVRLGDCGLVCLCVCILYRLSCLVVLLSQKCDRNNLWDGCTADVLYVPVHFIGSVPRVVCSAKNHSHSLAVQQITIGGVSNAPNTHATHTNTFGIRSKTHTIQQPQHARRSTSCCIAIDQNLPTTETADSSRTMKNRVN